MKRQQVDFNLYFLVGIAYTLITIVYLHFNVPEIRSEHNIERLHPMAFDDPFPAAHMASNIISEKLKIHIPVQSDLPIYWINMDESQSRRDCMEKAFSNIAASMQLPSITRISATVTADVQAMLATNDLCFANSVIQDPPRQQLKNIYEFKEAATTLSHLRAILQAYEDGHDRVLILEDDAALTASFMQNWRSYVETAPLGWTILQLATNNKQILVQSADSLLDPWISWFPDHFSNRAYIINREGMQRILSETHFLNLWDDEVWFSAEPGLVVVDELTYFLARDAYTSTFPFIDATGAPSTQRTDKAHGTIAELGLGFGDPISTTTHLPESIFVYMCVHADTIAELEDEITRISKDVYSLCSIHSRKCEWAIHFVTTKKGFLVELEEEARSRLPLHHVPDVFGHYVPSVPYNEFQFLPMHLPKMVYYDLFLFKTAWQRIAGFPWLTFMHRSKDALVAAPLAESDERSLFRSREKLDSMQFKFFEASAWRKLLWLIGEHTWSSNQFLAVKPIEMKYVGMHFVRFHASFAFWFFSRILTEEFLGQSGSWGPEAMWCEAALDFDRFTPSCLLVPVVSRLDDRLDKSSSMRSAWGEGYDVFQSKDSTTAMRRWFDASKPQRGLLRDVELKPLKFLCNKKKKKKTARGCGTIMDYIVDGEGPTRYNHSKVEV